MMMVMLVTTMMNTPVILPWFLERLHPSEKEGVFDRHRSHMNGSVLKDSYRLLEDDTTRKPTRPLRRGHFKRKFHLPTNDFQGKTVSFTGGQSNWNQKSFSPLVKRRSFPLTWLHLKWNMCGFSEC